MSGKFDKLPGLTAGFSPLLNMSRNLFIRLIEHLRKFIEEGGFAAFTFCLLLGFDALLLGLLLTPGGDSGIGAFADELRVWCFGFDPATGKIEWSYVFSMLFPPVMLSGLLILFWGKSMRRIFSHPSSLASHLLPALVLVAGAGASFALLASPNHESDLPFPAEEIRTGLPAPTFNLIDQTGEEVDLAALRGKVVVLTGVYASCVHTCPTILIQAKTAIEDLPPDLLEDLQFVAVTMDPTHDTPEVLKKFADVYGISTPLYHLVTGEKEKVEATLDFMGIARERDKETGIISHSNQFVLIDRNGKVAYRLGLGERQQKWLTSAMSVLLQENITRKNPAR